MKKLLLLVLVTLAGGSYMMFYSKAQDYERQQKETECQAQIKKVDAVNAFIKSINEAKTVAQLESLEAELAHWLDPDGDAHKKVRSTILLKKARVSFDEAEELLQQAISLQQALNLPPLPPPLPPPQSELADPHNHYNSAPPSRPELSIHPAAQEALIKADKLYVDSKKYLDKLSDIPGDTSYNFSLNYLKGEVYYRHTMFRSSSETVQDLFTQTATYYKKALSYKPGDVDTTVNIELLLKQQQGMMGEAGQSQPQRMLNQMGMGKSKGN